MTMRGGKGHPRPSAERLPDDVAGEAAMGWDEHRHAQRIEDVEFLWRAGVSPEAIAERLGIRRDSIDYSYRLAGRPLPWAGTL